MGLILWGLLPPQVQAKASVPAHRVLPGLSTYNSPGGSTRINSPLLLLELVRAVAFAATAGVAELDAHCLMDNPHKGGHDCYFDRFGKAQLPPPPLSLSHRANRRTARLLPQLRPARPRYPRRVPR